MWNQSFSFGASRAARARRFAALCAAVVAVTFSSGLLRGSMPDVQTGTWVPTGSMSTARSGSSAVLLPSGDVLVTGGAGASEGVETVDLFGADGSFSAGAPMNEGRVDHSAVLLRDGRVLVVGGRNANGAVVSAEIYSQGAWTTIPGPTDARWGHTATVLKDGRVLVAGGENAAGALMSIELFDPETGAFAVAGTMASGRKGHAAAVLSDGRVMIAGGASGDAVLATTEIFSPETLQVSAGPSLNTLRWGLTATTLLDGRVLFTGGFNGTQNVASAEIYSDVSNAITFTASSTPMVARRNHQAFLLPNNNAVLLVGGVAEAMVDGVLTARATSAAELFLPWLNEVWQTAGMTVARAQASGAVLSNESYGVAPAGEGLVVVAGGGPASSEAYRFATIRVDKDDYLPGMKVKASGTGWLPNEEVVLSVREVPAEHASRTVTVVANGSGEIVDAFLFDVEEHHLGVRFFLNARGAASQAQTTFTDGSATVTGVVTNSVTGNPIAGATVTCAAACNNPATATTAANGSYSLTINFSGNSSTVSIQASATGFSGASANVVASNAVNPVRDFALVPASSVTTLSVAPASGTYGGLAVLSATLTSGSTPVTGKSVAFTLNGTPVGSGTTNTFGVASVNNVGLSGINVGSYASAVAATFAGDATLASSSASGSLTVTKASQTITFAAPSSPAAYNSTFAVSATSDSGLSVTIVATGACSIVSGTVTMLSGTGACTLTASQAGDGNYNAAPAVVRTVTAGKASQTITFNVPASPAIFNSTFAVAPTSDSSLAVSVVASGVCSIASGTVTMTSGTGTCTLTASQAGNDNYASATDVARTVTAAKATQTITFDAPASPATFNSTFAVAPTSDSSLAVSVVASGVCSIASGTVTMTSGTGTCTLTASQAGNDNYASATDVVRTVTAAKATQTITFTAPISTATYYTSFTVAPTSDSTLAVSVDASGACSIAGTIVSMNSGTGTCNLTARQPGDDNYSAAADVVHAVVAAKADAVINVNGFTGTYDGAAHGATGTAVGIEENPTELAALLHLGDSFTGVPGGTASWTFDGNSNYNAASGTAAIVITKANATIMVDGFTGPYDGQAHGASGTATGVQNEALAGLDLGGSFTNVPGGTANWTFTDVTGNYNNANGTAAIVISRAQAIINVVGYTGVYDGNPHGAAATAAGVESTPADLTALLQLGDSFSIVPGGMAHWTFAGNGNYEPASGSVAIVLTRAASTTTVTCPDHVTYNGTAQTPCSVSVTGAGNLNLSPTATYANNINAGTATASHAFAGDTNHEVSSDSRNFTIDKAPSATVLTFEAGPYVYRAVPFGASAHVTGVGGLTQPVAAITYTGDCTNVTLVNGCTGTAAYSGDANHLGSTDSKSITITPRILTVTPAGGKVKVVGTEFTAFTGSIVGLQGSDGGNAAYASTGAPAPAAVGQYDITSAFVFTTGLASNYTIVTNTAVKGLWVQYLWDGFLQPINDTAHDAHTTAPYSSFKPGQTIPVKFELKNASGQIVVQTGNPIFQRTGNLGACGATTLESLTESVAADADGLYKLAGSQYNYGWSTKGLTNGLYQIYAKLADGTSRSVLICLTK